MVQDLNIFWDWDEKLHMRMCADTHAHVELLILIKNLLFSNSQAAKIVLNLGFALDLGGGIGRYRQQL